MPRPWGELTDSEKQAVVELFLYSGRKYQAIDFENLDLEHTTNTERRIRYAAQRYVPTTPIPQSQTPQYVNEVIQVKGDAIVTGDWEIPDHSAELLELAREVGKKQRIKKLIINGDTIAADGLSVLPIGGRPTPSTVQEDVVMARKIITSMTEWFDEVYIISGNHCKRLRWGTHGEFTADFLLADIPGVITTPFSRLYLTSGKQEWLICHPKTYSKVPGTLARDIAEIENINVVAAHTHLLSWSITKDGRHLALDGGHCRDASRTLYKVEMVTRHPQWCAGFVVIRDGYACALSKDFTDWAYWV